MARLAVVILLSLSAIAEVSADDVKDIPAANRQRYPDSVGYLYEGPLATILWMENHLPFVQLDQLKRRLARGMARGLSGEVVDDSLDGPAALPSGEPTLPELTKRAVQTVRLLAQYTTVARDYGGSLQTALQQYNTDETRRTSILEAAGRVDAALRAAPAPRPGGPLPADPPAAEERVVQPGRYFADAVLDGKREYLRRRAQALARAIQSSNPTAYGRAFADVFYAQRDPELATDALEALATNHQDGILRGHAFDRVVENTVLRAVDPSRPFSMDQLRLINQLNLLAHGPAAPREPLVAALLLLEEDHRRAGEDAELSVARIDEHRNDTTWLVAQVVRLTGGDTTEAAVHELIDSILDSI